MNDQSKKLQALIVGILKNHGVKKASLFGSVVRGEDTSESDIDLLVEFEGRKSLLDLVCLKMDLEESLHRPVEVLTYRSLHPLLKNRILMEQENILHPVEKDSRHAGYADT